MGCRQSIIVKQPIEITGQAIDPLQMSGDIIKNIQNDPHIQFCQNKLQSIFLSQHPPNGQKGKFQKVKTTEQIKSKFVTSDKLQQQKYLQAINKSLKQNDLTATNILSFMINQIADIREKEKTEKKFDHQEQYAALKCFIYLYTGNYSYKKIHQTLRKSDYQNISKIIAVVKVQLEKYQKQGRLLKVNLKNEQTLELHRGIQKPDKTMKIGVKLYWRSFTSTSTKSQIAKKFGNYTYKIQLNTKSPHDFMIVPAQLSQFDEQQVILFPYFHFECIDTYTLENGARYTIKQVLQRE